jgi:hypothetical protein
MAGADLFWEKSTLGSTRNWFVLREKYRWPVALSEQGVTDMVPSGD